MPPQPGQYSQPKCVGWVAEREESEEGTGRKEVIKTVFQIPMGGGGSG